jgi:hypothetical protein
MTLILSGTDGLSDVDGSAATPAIRGTDANTGIFFPAADTIAFAEGGAEVARFDSDGDFGIGTSSPGGKLSVVGASNANLGTLAQFSIPGGQGFFLNSNSTGLLNTLAVGTGENLAFNTGASERMRIDSSGNVGIGTSSPSTYVSNGGLAIFGLFGTSSKAMTIYNNSGANASNVARIDFKLNNTFSNQSTSAAIYGINPNAAGNNGGALVFATSSDGTDTNPSERARIDSNGRMQLNTTSNKYSALLTLVKGVNSYNLTSSVTGTANSGHMVFENNNADAVGTIFTSGSNTAYNTSSDYRLKEDIAPMTGALAKVALLKPCIYKWKVDGSDGQGFIAHELAEVCPDAVTGDKDAVDADGKPQHQGVDTSFLVATLTAAIQEQQALIQSLTDRITALETPAVTPPVNEQPA